MFHVCLLGTMQPLYSYLLCPSSLYHRLLFFAGLHRNYWRESCVRKEPMIFWYFSFFIGQQKHFRQNLWYRFLQNFMEGGRMGQTNLDRQVRMFSLCQTGGHMTHFLPVQYADSLQIQCNETISSRSRS